VCSSRTIQTEPSGMGESVCCCQRYSIALDYWIVNINSGDMISIAKSTIAGYLTERGDSDASLTESVRFCDLGPVLKVDEGDCRERAFPCCWTTALKSQL
jgi:hypothetical protein